MLSKELARAELLLAAHVALYMATLAALCLATRVELYLAALVTLYLATLASGLRYFLGKTELKSTFFAATGDVLLDHKADPSATNWLGITEL